MFTIHIYLSWHFLLGLCWSGCSQYRFIYIGTFFYAYIGLGVHNTDLFILTLSVSAYIGLSVHNTNLFIMALSVMIALVWVFTIQIYLSWHFMLCLHWSGCSQYIFIYLGTFCYTYIGLGVHNTDLFISALSVMLTLVWVFTLQIYLS